MARSVRSDGNGPGETFVHGLDVVIWAVLRRGWPQGVFMLDWRQAGICDLAYLGLMPQSALALADHCWKQSLPQDGSTGDVSKMSVNTLNYPRALGFYQRAQAFGPCTSQHGCRF